MKKLLLILVSLFSFSSFANSSLVEIEIANTGIIWNDSFSVFVESNVNDSGEVVMSASVAANDYFLKIANPIVTKYSESWFMVEISWTRVEPKTICDPEKPCFCYSWNLVKNGKVFLLYDEDTNLRDFYFSGDDVERKDI
jgi:hypothetical protein